jgi:hypothetical protein
MPRFEREKEFREIERRVRVVDLRSGRIGDPGEPDQHTAPDEHAAILFFDSCVAAWLAEGFVPIEQSEPLGDIDPVLGAAILAAMAPERLDGPGGAEALRAAWSVLGDWLSARGDVRGELISLDEAIMEVDGPVGDRLIQRRDQLLTSWMPRWFGLHHKLEGRPDLPMHFAWHHGFITAARVGTEPGRLDLSRWRLGLRDLVEVLANFLSHPLTVLIQQLRIAELDPPSSSEPSKKLSKALPLLKLTKHPALLRLELGGVSRGDWVRDETGNMTQRPNLQLIDSLHPLMLAKDWAPRLAALRVIGRGLRYCPPMPQLRVLELYVAAFDEEVRGWLIGGPWPRLERLWLRSTTMNDPWANAGDQLDELLASLHASPLRELGLHGPTALDRLIWMAVSAPLRLEELRLFGLGEASAGQLLDAHDYLEGVGRIVLEDTQIVHGWPELQRRYGSRLHRCNETFGVIGERTGNMLTESLFDAPGWRPGS